MTVKQRKVVPPRWPLQIIKIFLVICKGFFCYFEKIFVAVLINRDPIRHAFAVGQG